MTTRMTLALALGLAACTTPTSQPSNVAVASPTIAQSLARFREGLGPKRSATDEDLAPSIGSTYITIDPEREAIALREGPEQRRTFVKVVAMREATVDVIDVTGVTESVSRWGRRSTRADDQAEVGQRRRIRIERKGSADLMVTVRTSDPGLDQLLDPASSYSVIARESPDAVLPDGSPAGK